MSKDSNVSVYLAEEWKYINGYEGKYEVSNTGRVRSCSGRNAGLIHSGAICSKGYKRVCLYKDGKQRIFRVHRLVAKAFIENSDNLPQVNHKDCDKLNNHIDNLEWCDNQYNHNHKMKNGLNVTLKGSRHGMAKINEDDVREIKHLLSVGYSHNEISNLMGVNTGTVSMIKNGKQWKHVRR